MGEARYFLGLEITRREEGIHINQRKYILDILKDACFIRSKPVHTPLPKELRLRANQGEPLPDPNRFRRLVGRLLYLNITRLDVTYAVQHLSQYVGAPTLQHWHAALHTLRYLKGCPSKGVFFPANNDLQPTAYCDAGWASCLDSRRSITGYCVMPALVSWRTKKQNTVSCSSAEVEYQSMASTIREVQRLTYLLCDFRIKYKQPINVWCDNSSALHITANPVFHERTKHLEIDCHIVREKYQTGMILPQYVPSHSQIADVFTKALVGPQFQFLVSKLGLSDIHQGPT